MTMFDEDWLQKQGVEGSDDRLIELADILLDEFELRVGDDIANHLSASQITEFEALIDKTSDDESDEVRINWLKQAYPDYTKAVTAQKTKLARQFRAAPDKEAFIISLQSD